VQIANYGDRANRIIRASPGFKLDGNEYNFKTSRAGLEFGNTLNTNWLEAHDVKLYPLEFSDKVEKNEKTEDQNIACFLTFYPTHCKSLISARF